MDIEVFHSIRLLLNEIFNRDHYNIPQLDGVKCEHCHRSIKVCKKTIKGKNHKCIQITDRSVRIDCDEADGDKTKNVAYHKECWKLVLQQKAL